jgi:hypothetical protein
MRVLSVALAFVGACLIFAAIGALFGGWWSALVAGVALFAAGFVLSLTDDDTDEEPV